MTVILSAYAAHERARAYIGRSNVPGYCLAWVYAMFGSIPSTGPGQGHFSTAMDGWNYARKRHTSRTPPAGVPVYFGISPTRTDRNKRAGDVVISDGNGYVLATDYPYAGVVGRLSIAQRAAQTQRPYLGWTGDFLGHDVQYSRSATTSIAGLASTVIGAIAPKPTQKDSDMTLLVKNTAKTGNYHGFEGSITNGVLRHFTTPGKLARIQKSGITLVKVNGDNALIELCHAHNLSEANVKELIAQKGEAYSTNPSFFH